MKTNQIVAIIVISLIYSIHSISGLIVRPTLLFLNSPEKSTSVTVKNTSENLIEVSIEFKYGYFMSDENGILRLMTEDSLDNFNRSLLSYVRVFPQSFTLGPEEVRTIRIYVDFPKNSVTGEYWARMYVTPKILQKLQVKKSQPTIEVVTVIDVPVNYRLGNVSTGIILENIFDIKENDGKISFNTLLRRTGNGAFWGSLNIRLLDKSGKIKGNFVKNISVYKVLQIPIEINVEDKSAKIEKIQIIAESKRSDIDKKKLIQTKKEEWIIPYKPKD